MLPVGFSYVSSSLTDEGEVTEVDARTVRFTLQGGTNPLPTPLPRPAWSVPILSGTLRDDDRKDHNVGCPCVVTVRRLRDRTQRHQVLQPGNSGAGGEVVVTIAATDYGSLGGHGDAARPGSATYPAVLPMKVRSPRLMLGLSGSPCRGIPPLPTPLPRPAWSVPIPFRHPEG